MTIPARFGFARPGETAFAAIGIVCLLLAIRTFDSSVTLEFFDQNNGPVGLVLGPYLAGFLVAAAALVVSPRRLTAGAAAVLGMATLVEVLVRQQWIEFGASIAALVAGMWWLAAIESARRSVESSSLVYALPVALSLDFVLRIAAHTEPLNELWLPAALVVVVAGLAVFAFAARVVLTHQEAWTAPDTRGMLGLAALPPLLALADTTTLNPAQIAAAAGFGRGPEGPVSVYVGAVAVGLGLFLGWVVLRWRGGSAVAGAAALAAGFVLIWAHAEHLALAGGTLAAAGTVLSAAALAGGDRRWSDSPVMVSLGLGLGWALLAFGTFLFYSRDNFVPALAALAVFAVSAALVAQPSHSRVRPSRLTLLVAILATAVPPLFLIFATQPAFAGAKSLLRVMTYNVHLGYGNQVLPNIDGIAETIARESPDIVLLQEVARGGTIAGDHEVMTILSERLHMAYVFQPEDGDLYGVGILSRERIDGAREVRLDQDSQVKLQPRRALIAKVAGLDVAVVHLLGDQPSFILEVRTVLRAVHGDSRVIIGGDFNSGPSSPQMALLSAAGFTDLAVAGGADDLTVPAGNPTLRGDYIWGLGVRAIGAGVVPSTDSDHRPVVVDIAQV